MERQLVWLDDLTTNPLEACLPPSINKKLDKVLAVFHRSKVGKLNFGS